MNKIKIWITGANGNIGSNLVNFFTPLSYTILSTDSEVNVTDYEAVYHYASRNRPDIIINCAAMTGFQRCQENRIDAYKVNALGARNCALAAQSIRAKIIQISSDDVYSCDVQQIMNEFDVPFPKTTYGKTKLAGENFVRELNPKHIIIRSSWIYDAYETGFLMTLIQNAKSKKEDAICSTQFSSPTSITIFCKVLVSLIESGEYGVFHTSCNGVTSRYDFAKTVLEYCQLPITYLHSDTTIKDGQNGYTILENLMLEMTNIYPMPSWQEDLSNFLLNQGLGENIYDEKK